MEEEKKCYENVREDRENCGLFSWCRDCEHLPSVKCRINRWDYLSYQEEYFEYLEAFYDERE